MSHHIHKTQKVSCRGKIVTLKKWWLRKPCTTLVSVMLISCASCRSIIHPFSCWCIISFTITPSTNAVLLVGVPCHLVPGQELGTLVDGLEPDTSATTLMNHEIMRSDHEVDRTVLKFHFRQRWRHATHLPAFQFFLHNS